MMRKLVPSEKSTVSAYIRSGAQNRQLTWRGVHIMDLARPVLTWVADSKIIDCYIHLAILIDSVMIEAVHDWHEGRGGEISISPYAVNEVPECVDPENIIAGPEFLA
jgi:hypothetical protein